MHQKTAAAIKKIANKIASNVLRKIAEEGTENHANWTNYYKAVRDAADAYFDDGNTQPWFRDQRNRELRISYPDSPAVWNADSGTTWDALGTPGSHKVHPELVRELQIARSPLVFYNSNLGELYRQFGKAKREIFKKRGKLTKEDLRDLLNEFKPRIEGAAPNNKVQQHRVEAELIDLADNRRSGAGNGTQIG